MVFILRSSFLFWEILKVVASGVQGCAIRSSAACDLPDSICLRLRRTVGGIIARVWTGLL